MNLVLITLENGCNVVLQEDYNKTDLNSWSRVECSPIATIETFSGYEKEQDHE